MTDEMIINLCLGALGAVFMWGLNRSFSSTKTEITNKFDALDGKIDARFDGLEGTVRNHREDIRELFNKKTDKEMCKEYRDNCIARQRA